jgi:NADH-quinone oxidoreductase subunit A
MLFSQMLPTAIVAYLALFATVGFLFVLVSLILGWFLRAQSPSREKAATYECGEPSIGPNNVQFDLRFYVVALVFLIFEVEVAFFFPPAVVFGKANQLRQPECHCPRYAVQHQPDTLTFPTPEGNRSVECPLWVKMCPIALQTYAEFGVPVTSIVEDGKESKANAGSDVAKQADTLSLASLLDLSVFFAVLLVGFAFVWSRGDLTWVRATRHPTTTLETAVIMSKMRKGDL